MSVYIYAAKRSAIGKFKKSLSKTSCRELSKQVVFKLFDESNIDRKLVDKVIVGNVLSASLGQNIARQVQIDSNIPMDKCAFSVNMVCGSGLKAVNLGFNEILLKNAHCVLVGGVENMSMSPLLKNRFDENAPLIDHMINDALTDVFSNKHMGITAENVAEIYNITRAEQDQFSLESQKKACKAIEEGKFKDEIVPVNTTDDKMFSVDEFPRVDTTIEKLSELKTAFKDGGTVTAGNASGINDGCAFLLIGDETISANKIVEIVDFAEMGCDPNLMGMGPYYAISSLLEKNKLDLMDIDLYEINEAFAAQSVAVIKELSKKYNVDSSKFKERINVNGGAVSLGHPVGASGARVLVSLIYEMKRRNSKYGIASLCIGGGMGISVLIKNVGGKDDIK